MNMPWLAWPGCTSALAPSPNAAKGNTQHQLPLCWEGKGGATSQDCMEEGGCTCHQEAFETSGVKPIPSFWLQHITPAVHCTQPAAAWWGAPEQ